jgi:Ca2+-binding EF-hand superfamily protein
MFLYCVLSDNSQSLSYEELFQACAHAGVQLSPKEGEQLVAMIDKDGSGCISAAEFMKYYFFCSILFF